MQSLKVGGQFDLHGESITGKSVIGSFSYDSLSCCTAVLFMNIKKNNVPQ